MKVRILEMRLVDKETGEEILNDEIELYSLNQTNDLVEAPYSLFLGNRGKASYSRGFFIKLEGYIKNPKIIKDMKSAMKENGI